MSADDIRFFIAGFASPILILYAVFLWRSFVDWIEGKRRRWEAKRYNTIYSRGYEAGKRDCGEDPTR